MEQLLTLYSEVQSTDVRWLWYPFFHFRRQGLSMAGMQPQLFEKQQPDTEPKFDTEQQKAAYWIKHFLEKGDMSANEIYCRLDNEGVSKRVARMVKTEMGIHCYQKKRRWYWSVQLEEGAMNGPQV